MNTRSKTILAMIGVAFFALIFSAPVIKAQNPVDLLNRMDKHYKTMVSLASGIKMDKYNSQLGEHDLYDGKLILLPKQPKRQMYARIDWIKPRAESLAIIGDTFQLFVPNTGQALTGKTDKNHKGVPKGAFDFLGMSRADLKANYEPAIAGDETIEGGVGATHLILKPKGTPGYKLAELWVDPNGMVRMARITDNNNDTTTVLLYNFKKNETVDASAFTIRFPKGVKPKPV